MSATAASTPTVTAAGSSAPGTRRRGASLASTLLTASPSTRRAVTCPHSRPGGDRELQGRGLERLRVDLLDLARLDLHDDRRGVLVLARLVELDRAVEGEQRLIDAQARDRVAQLRRVGGGRLLQARRDHLDRLVRQHRRGLHLLPVLLLEAVTDLGHRAARGVVVV